MSNQDIISGPDTFKVEKLYNLYKQKPSKILFDTEYQRSLVWKTPKKQLLIDSMMREWDINKIFLREQEGGVYECLDGQQRLRSIFDFIDNRFPLGNVSSDLGLEGKTMKELKKPSPQLYWGLLNYRIGAVVIHQADDETTSAIFLRLQEGMPLNSAEKLNAMRGILRNRVVEICKYPFWHSLGVKNNRFGHRYLCAQIVSLELANINLPDSGLNISEVRFAILKRNYKSYKDTEPPQKVSEQIRKTLNFLNKALGTKAQIIRQRGDVIPLYLLASYLLKRYASVKQERDKFKDFIEQFLAKVYGSEDHPYVDYRDARSKATESRKSIEEGFKIILGKFLEFVPNLRLKDEKRLFDYGQKLAIYYRDENKCRQCGKRCKFEEAEFHHVKPWHEGGHTTVKNGLLLCHKCHAKQPKFTKKPRLSKES